MGLLLPGKPIPGFSLPIQQDQGRGGGEGEEAPAFLQGFIAARIYLLVSCNCGFHPAFPLLLGARSLLRAAHHLRHLPKGLGGVTTYSSGQGCSRAAA